MLPAFEQCQNKGVEIVSLCDCIIVTLLYAAGVGNCDPKLNVSFILPFVLIESPGSIINVARRLQSEIPNSYILDQYANPENPRAHEFGTAEEIRYQTSEKVEVVLAGAETGGIITGLSRGLKKQPKYHVGRSGSSRLCSSCTSSSCKKRE